MRDESETSAFEALGGAAALEPIIRDFVARMVDDVMIGFFFDGVDRGRLEAMEYQFTARFLGADVEYLGRPIRAAHARHPIMGGQFDRRKKLLEETLLAHAVPPELRAAWLRHVESLRALVTRDGAGECDDGGARPR